MKKYILLLVVFLACGCSPKYSLEINGTKIEENISFTIDKSLIKEEELGPEADLYSQDSINYILNDDIYPVINSNEKIYNKSIKDNKSSYDINFNYIYQGDELSNSQILSQCFENKEIIVDDDKISIHLSGRFNCLYDNNSSVEFIIHTANKIESSSLKHNFLTNDFVWKIDKSNAHNVDIELTVLTEKKLSYYGIRVIVVIGISIVFGLIAYFGHKLSKRSDINEI